MAKPKKELPMPKINSSERHFVLALVASILIPIVRLLFKVEPKGIEKLPKHGSYILVSNHVTNLDALAVAYFVYVQLKRAPHFLAKESLFRIPGIGGILRAAGQIPVYRSGHRNDTPLKAAHAYLKAGHSIAIFPEGTLTRSPDLWPMRGKSGAIRLALETGVPVYPVGQWGSEKVLPQYGSKFRPGFWKPVRILVGDEIDLSDYRKRQLNPDQLNDATKLVMQTITQLVEELRGEKAPLELWDPAKAGQTTSGNFKKARK
ncbi:lysophospholipid acyltransferase family protein [Rhodoluna lacicola]|jgi:1-acyl-sn-glycerol-3-phosphate acyltransferase|uniref:1-acyl-sn-glycerol-3-phosphate acyltransferase n=1 Tax=Rhodoluna lacicola TaxID=529884 RepID=A0A060JNS7_9MICO|nr:lysophospholipid acyltransferase family protein [Rhodoluna lacicola]AIC47859.1 1-acyl-sn-glycerol-3-phosphate acyltransferase [Rhodoluna lacicola]BDS50765.1 1-acyl-sn-glycerol-3-phosphate acyltransferase [Rhodoluna lacicola]